MAAQLKTPIAPKTAAKKKPSTKPRLISSKLAYKGKVFSVFTDTVEEPGGNINVRDVIRHNGSVVILAVDESKNPNDPDIIFERQYRHAAGQFLIELPAGRVEPKEAPLAAAKRELIEETGYRAKRWKLLTKYFASPGFLGIPLSEALALVAANKIHDGKTLIGLMLYDAARRTRRL
jgi:ADP-ribose pyrophosphatase